MSKKIALIILSYIAVIGVGVYGGMKYGESKAVLPGGGNFGNLSAADTQARFQQRGGATNGSGTGAPRMGGGMVLGEIISKDDKSITVSVKNGGSKIIFLGDSVLVNKSVAGSLGDLKVGDSVSVSGSANSDGSINAKSIQIQTK